MSARWRTVTAALITAWRRARQVRVQPESGQWRHWGRRLRWQRQVLACHLGRGGQLALAACGLLLGYGALAQCRSSRTCSSGASGSARRRAFAGGGADRLAQQLRAQLSEDMNPRKQALLAQLSQAGLIVFDAAYRDEPEAGGKLRRVSVELSAAGRYPELMAALVALKAQPLLRLETLTLERAQTTNVMLSIRMRLSMLGGGNEAAVLRLASGVCAGLRGAVAGGGDRGLVSRPALGVAATAGCFDAGPSVADPALAAPLPVPMPEAAPEPFTALGEWRQQGQRVLVLQGQSDSYLLCAACKLPRCGRARWSITCSRPWAGPRGAARRRRAGTRDNTIPIG